MSVILAERASAVFMTPNRRKHFAHTMNMKKDGRIAVAVIIALGAVALGLGLGLTGSTRKSQLDACVYFGLSLWLI